MRAINHALTGAIIGLVVGEPLLAVPAAVTSHFVCDALPHHGHDDKSDSAKHQQLRSKLFRYQLYVDALLCAGLVAILFALTPNHWLLAAICAFAAAAPDFLWFRRYLAALRNHHWQPTKFDAFAGNIQWFQRPIGFVVEIAWFLGVAYLLLPFLR